MNWVTVPSPPPVKTVKDVKVGHYAITYKGIHMRAYSWTYVRSPKKALELPLRKSWEVSIRKEAIHPLPEVMAEIDELPHREIPVIAGDDDED